MKIEKIDIKILKPSEYNPRKDLQPEDTEYKKIKRSVEEFGYVDPLIINKDLAVIGGHQRLKVLKELGYKEIDCVVVDLDKIKEKALNIALNKIEGEWDLLKLKDLLLELDTSEIDMDITGFEYTDLEELMTQFYTPEENEKDDIVPEVSEEPITKLGDLYKLDKHRLLCGDAIKTSDVEKLMNGQKADMVFTDPPYGINAVKKSGKVGGGGKLGFVGYNDIVKANIYSPIIGDDKPFDPTFLLEYGANQIIFGANYFANKLPISSGWIIWDKREDENKKNNFADCEILWSSFKKSARIYRHLWMGLLRKGNRKDESKNYLHPTQKPVKLISDILNDYSERNEIILDLYGGSGSTLIACQKLKRKCYMMELDPYYCDVIVKRWEDYTDKKVELILNECRT